MQNSSLYELDKNLGDYIFGFLEGGRQLLLAQDIDEKVVTSIAGKLIQMDCLEVKPITLLIHCAGGDVPSAYYLKNVIDALNSPVHGLVIGKASSMAVDVLQMCAKRMMLPYAELFCHFTRCGNFRLISNDDEFSIKDAEMIRKWALGHKKEREEFYAKRTGKSIQQIQEIFKQGEYFGISISAKEAIEINFADEIVTDFKFFPGFKGKNYKQGK